MLPSLAFHKTESKFAFNTENHTKRFPSTCTYLCQVFAGFALVLVTAGMEVAGDGGDAQVELAVLHEDVLQVVTPHGPGLHQDIVHLYSCWKGLVSLVWPKTRMEGRKWALESEGQTWGYTELLRASMSTGAKVYSWVKGDTRWKIVRATEARGRGERGGCYT